MEAQQGPKIPKSFKEKDNSKRLIVVLEYASLETVKVSLDNLIRSLTKPELSSQSGKDYHLLNCDDHMNQLVKAGRDPAEERPDITHQVSSWAAAAPTPI